MGAAYNLAKRRCDSVKHCGDTAILIFDFFQNNGRPPSWIFKKSYFDVPMWFRVGRSVIVPNFSVLACEMAIFKFLKSRSSATLHLQPCICFTPAWDHPQRIVVDFYRCTKFGWNQQCNVEDMRVSVL